MGQSTGEQRSEYGASACCSSFIRDQRKWSGGDSAESAAECEAGRLQLGRWKSIGIILSQFVYIRDLSCIL
jgi:hypothetical protein